MIRRLPSALRWLLYLALPLLIIYFTLNVMLTSTAFSRFVLDQVEDQVPELRFAQVRGNFLRGLSMNLHYASSAQNVQAKGLDLQLGLECLWQMKLCIRRLHVDELMIVLHESDQEEAEEQDAELSLPDVGLPIDIELQSLTLGRLQIFAAETPLYELSDLNSSLSWQGSTLFMEGLAATDDWCQWALAGQINLRDHYPLELALACESMQGFGAASAQIGGDLDQLHVALGAELTSPYNPDPAAISIVLSLGVLDADLPVAAHIALEPARFEREGMLIQLQASELSIEGPLLAPAIQAALNFESPFWEGLSQLTLAAQATSEALLVDELLLQLPEGRMNVAGRLDYSEALNWQGEISWRDIALEQFAEGFSGQLHGIVMSEVDYRDENLRAELNLSSVDGSILDRSFAAAGRLRYAGEILQLEGLDLRQGDNRIQLAGDLSLEQNSNVRLTLDLPLLRELIPEQWLEQFEGALEGELQLSGSLEQPALEGNLLAQNLRYDDIALERGELTLDWRGADQPSVNARLHLERLSVADDMVARITLSGQGQQTDHSLTLEAQGQAEHQDKRVLMQCRGGFAGALTEAWRGQCGQLEIDFAVSEQQQWRLQQAMQLSIDPAAPEIELSAFCLAYEDATLCSQRSLHYQGDTLAPITVAGENFSADWFQDFLPAEALELAGSWAIHFSATDLLGEEPRLNASLSSSDLAAIWNDPQHPLTLQAEQLSLEWSLAQQRHQLSWILDTAGSGSSRGELSLLETSIGGRLSIDGVELADYGHLFLPAADDEVAGQLNANLAMSGTLEQPLLNGELNLAGGRFRSAMLPVPLEDIELRLAIEDNSADINGQYRAAESEGRLGGEFRWEGLDWSGHMSIAAEPLLIQPEPTMSIHVAPDLRFDFEAGRIAISGNVAIPRAELEITELPEQAVSVSADTVIVGAAESEDGPPLEILVNIELRLGDRVVFEGFGLETNITGNLRLQQRSGEMMRASGRLSLVEGRYNAYAQNLVIRSGDLVFVGDIDNPQLRVEAVRGDTPENITVGLRASGSARNPQVSLFSQPDMPQQAQLSYLITGTAPGVTSDVDPQMAAAEAALSYALESGIGTGITRRAGDALGIDDLQVTAGTTDAGTQIGLSGYVTPRLLVRYGVGVFDTINTWTLRYQVSRSVYLEAISGEASDIGVMWSFERN